MQSDDYIINHFIGDHLIDFCVANIHPNIITFLALIFSILILYFHFNHYYWLVVLAIVLRTFFDCLDGSVARKCEKTSKLGGYFDTFADGIFLYSMVFIVIKELFKISYFDTAIYTFIFMEIGFFIYFTLYNPSALFDHAQFKSSKNIISFYVNNTLLINTIIAIIYITLIKYVHI
jgi:phosphatidylserine synthase